MRLDGAYYVFLFHICQADNGADYAKFAADFIEIQHFMLLLRGLRGCRHISTYMDVCFWGVFIRHCGSLKTGEAGTAVERCFSFARLGHAIQPILQAAYFFCHARFTMCSQSFQSSVGRC